MFAGIPTPQIANPPARVLTDAENEVLYRALRSIGRHGVRLIESVSDAAGLLPPVIKVVKASQYPLKELKVQSAMNNPRFIFVECDEVAVFLDAFKKKQQKLARKDIKRAERRFVDLRERGECR